MREASSTAEQCPRLTFSDMTAAATGTEDELLAMSLTGVVPPGTLEAFETEKAAGNAAFHSADYALAIEHYNRAELANPASAVPAANRAQVYLRLREFAAARRDAAVALELLRASPNNPQAALLVKVLMRRAQACVELHAYQSAAADYVSVLEVSPRHPAATAGLNALRRDHGVVPTPSPPPVSDRGAGKGSRISIVNESPGSVSHSAQSARSVPPLRVKTLSRPAQTDSTLAPLSPEVIDSLVSKWSDTVPRSAFDFERTWKSLRGRDCARAQYLTRAVGAQRLKAGLLGETLTPQLLEDMARALSCGLSEDKVPAGLTADVLEALTHVSRIDMTVMFLSPAEKKPFVDLVSDLQLRGAQQQLLTRIGHCFT